MPFQMSPVALHVRQPGGGELLDAAPYPFRELPRGFTREGQAEDLGDPDQSVGQQPHHAVRHRLGLAAARAGDDDRRPERSLDHRLLLRSRERQAEGVGDLGRAQPPSRAGGARLSGLGRERLLDEIEARLVLRQLQYAVVVHPLASVMRSLMR